MNADEQFRREESREELEKLMSRVDQRLSRVLDMRIDESISEADFTRKRTELTQEKDLLLERLGRLSESQDSFLDNVAILIELTQDLALRFVSFSEDRKRDTIQRVFQRITITGSQVKAGSRVKPRVEVEHTALFSKLLGAIKFIQKMKSSKTMILGENENSDFELSKIGSDKRKSDDLNPSCSGWWAIQNKFRTLICESPPWKHLISYIIQHPKEDMEAALHALSLNDPSTS